MISYKPFFDTLKRKGITQYQLENIYNVSKGTLDNLRHNKSVTLNTIEDLCKIISCNPCEIFEFIKEE